MLIGELPWYSTLVTKALVEGVSPFSAPTPGLVDGVGAVAQNGGTYWPGCPLTG